MLCFKPPSGLGTLIGAGLAASFLSALPAQAVVPSPAPFQGNTATACSTAPISGSTIFGTPNFACQIGDKIYSNFSVRQDFNNVLRDSTYQFSVTDDNYTLKAFNTFVRKTGPSGAGVYSLGYKITVANFTSGNTLRIKTINTTASSSSSGTGLPDWSKTLIATNYSETLGPVNVSQTVPNTTNSNGPLDFDTTTSFADFVSTLTVANKRSNSVDSFSDTIVQTDYKAPPTDSVPGPLPVLGAGAAFGFSRKLRRRIKQAS
jgi:hypothetical protein